MKIICVGEMLIDFTPDGDPYTYRANPGGAPANVAVSIRRCGGKAAFLGKVGDDDFGRMLTDTLRAENVELLCSQPTSDAVTTLAFVTLYKDGNRSFTFARKPGADMLLTEHDTDEVDFSDCAILHAGSISQSSEPSRSAVLRAIELAKRSGALVSFDVNYRPSIWSETDCLSSIEELFPSINLLKISDEELGFVDGRENIPAFMKKHGISVVALTLGGNGAELYFGGSIIKLEAMKVKAVDTTGAGDSFWGAFLCSLCEQGVRKTSDLSTEKLTAAGRLATVSAGLCVQKSGGIPSLPFRDEINAILK